MKIFSSLLFLIYFASASEGLFPQSYTNLDRFLELADSTAAEILALIPENSSLEVTTRETGTTLVLTDRIVSGLGTGVRLLYLDSSDADIKLALVIIQSAVTYPGSFKENIFGSYMVKRYVTLKTQFLITSGGRYLNSGIIEKTCKDSIPYEDIRKAENRSLPFTTGDVPPESFFSGLLEPVIAISAAVLTVVLFFSVRSK